MPSPAPAADGLQGGDDDEEPCQGPLGAPRDPDTLTACCQELVGDAHCLDANTVPAEFQGYTTPCTGGGFCVPDKFIETGGVYTPKTCASIDMQPGVCLSICIPKVGEVYSLLPQDTCDEDERCAPCVNPFDMTVTGACDIAGTCVTGDEPVDETPPPDDGDDPATCVHEGDPVVNVATLTPCAEGAHCFDKQLVPADFQAQLAPCTDVSKLCVPDLFLETGGDFIPATCRSLADAEGRCLSLALPAVKDQEALLPQATCAAGERCVPCYSPLDSSDTGACALSCDTGPVEPPKALPTCCAGIGTCVPSSAVPAGSADRLGEDECPPGEGYLCAPDVFLAGTYNPPECEAGFIAFLFGEEYRRGACLPACLPDVDSAPFLGQDVCDDEFKCVPCLDPLSGEPSGACEPIGG